MKLIALVLLAALGTSAFADKKEYAAVTVDWQAKDLTETIVLQCDDAFYSGVNLTIPGELKYPEWYVSYEDCAVDWKLIATDVVTDSKTQEKSTVIRFKGGSRCSMRIREQTKPPTVPRIFNLDISDAC